MGTHRETWSAGLWGLLICGDGGVLHGESDVSKHGVYTLSIRLLGTVTGGERLTLSQDTHTVLYNSLANMRIQTCIEY